MKLTTYLPNLVIVKLLVDIKEWSRMSEEKSEVRNQKKKVKSEIRKKTEVGNCVPPWPSSFRTNEVAIVCYIP